ncbi:DUF4434 domain-containing protein [bacterium]|nr:DUF4434 domain-containing protein [bacterium]MBU1959239.1 DUF4434 domain-containing protein [bacterium]
MQKIKIPFDYSGSSSIKKYKYIFALLPVVSILLLIVLRSSFVMKDQANSAPIVSLFYQPLLKDEGKMEWEHIFKEMDICQIEQLVLQWSQHGVVDFVKDDKWLEEILSQAQKYNIKVIIGLYADDKYFKILENPHTNLEDYLEYLQKTNIEQAQKIYTIAKNYDAFDGWYIYDEIDDTNFATAKRQEALKKYLQALAYSLEQIAKYPIYISGYFSNHMSAEVYTKMFSDITQKKYTVFLQSGIGAQLVDDTNSSSYMQEFHQNFTGKFIPIVEGFTFNDGKIIAIDFDRLEQQINLLKNSSNIEQLSLFSLRYFFDEKLIEAYKAKYKR